MLSQLSPSPPARERAVSVCDALRQSDALIAAAIRSLGSGNGIAAAAGMPAERVLELEGRRLGSDVRMLMAAAAEQRTMPKLFDAFDRGIVSWGQVRWILLSAGRVPVAARTEIDVLIGDHADELADAEPYRLVQLVDDEVARRTPDRERRREERQVETEFLAIQAKLDGGSSIYGEYGPVATATIVDALDAAADRPRHPEDAGDDGDDVDADARTRAQQRGEALLRICESSLAGGNGGGTRPRPRLLATFNLDAHADAGVGGNGTDAAMKVLWGLTGRSPRLTRITAEELLCDAAIIPVMLRGGRAIGVGDETTTFSRKVRRGIIARDQGCRAPGCTAPVQWTDIHQLRPGYGRKEQDGALHCRADHRRAHRHKWTIRWLDGGILEYTIKGKIYISRPRT